jgi:hypothetical protein
LRKNQPRLKRLSCLAPAKTCNRSGRFSASGFKLALATEIHKCSRRVKSLTDNDTNESRPGDPTCQQPGIYKETHACEEAMIFSKSFAILRF